MNTQKYEYTIQLQGYNPEMGLEQDISTLNMLGADGWELVTVSAPTDSQTHGVAWHYFFRKPVQEG